MVGGPLSKWGSRLGAADIRRKSLQQLDGWRAGRFQNGALALAPRACVLEVFNSYRQGWRAGRFQNGSRLGAARTRASQKV